MRRTVRAAAAVVATSMVLVTAGCAADLQVIQGPGGVGLVVSPEQEPGAVSVESFARFLSSGPVPQAMVVTMTAEDSRTTFSMTLTVQGEEAEGTASIEVPGRDAEFSMIIVDGEVYIGGDDTGLILGEDIPSGQFVQGDASSSNRTLAQLTSDLEQQLTEAMSLSQAEITTRALDSVSYVGPVAGTDLLAFEVEVSGEPAVGDAETIATEGTMRVHPDGRLASMSLTPQDTSIKGTVETAIEYPASVPPITAPGPDEVYEL